MRRLVIIAPHYSVTERNGANIYCEWLAECARHAGFEPWILGEAAFGPVQQRSRAEALLVALVTRSNYYMQRLVPRAWGQGLKEFELRSDDILIFSFVYTYLALQAVLPNRYSRFWVLTHNYDPDVFDGWRDRGAIRSILGRWFRSDYLRRIRRSALSGVDLISISDADKNAFAAVLGRPGHTLRPGGRLPYAVRVVQPRIGGVRNLCFLGSLSTPFNVDALHFFGESVEPELLRLGLEFSFTVFGSRPASDVIKLAAEKGWRLIADLSDEELDVSLCEMDAAILPFRHTQGVKLKLNHFLSVGLPVVGTAVFEVAESKFCHFSNDLAQWVDFIDSVANHPAASKVLHAGYQRIRAADLNEAAAVLRTCAD